MLGRSLRRCPLSLRWRTVSSAAASSVPPTQFPSTLSLFRSADLAILSNKTPKYRPFHHSANHQQNAAAAVQEAEAEQPSGRDQAAPMGPVTKFTELGERGLVDPNVVRTITQGMGLDAMTQVQCLTINEALKGKDVLAQAKTGTGKTLGFLIPVLQNILTDDPSLAKPRRRDFSDKSSDIRAIVISPTRELAEQIAVEAKKVCKGTGVVIQTGVGGTQKSAHLRNMQREGCHILVGTPGRLKDILSDPRTGVKAPNLSAFVLDEADRLLDQGFWPEIQEIQDLLPNRQDKDRQTLMFSATVPQDVVKLVRSVMKPDLHYVRTVQDDEEPTHERVKQMLVSVPGLDNQLPTVLELCSREIAAANDPANNRKPFKAIVYFNATAEATLASRIFYGIRTNEQRRDEPSPLPSLLSNTRIYEIHSRLTQHQRTAAADHFRNAESAILMSSDVTARGMDFPNVTHVIQVGLPPERDSYIHRLGRTARAGQEGEGWLILPIPSLNEARTRLGKLPLQRDSSLEAAQVDLGEEVAGKKSAMSENTKRLYEAVRIGANKVDPENFENAYLSLLGTFQWWRNKENLISLMNRLAKVQWGMDTPPSVSRALASKLRIDGVNGVNIGSGRFREGPSSLLPSSDRRGTFGRTRDDGDRRPRPFGGDRDGGFRGGRGGDFGDRRGGFDRDDRRGGFGSGRENSRGATGSRGGFGGDRRGGFGDEGRGGYGRDRNGGFGGDRRGGSGRGGFGRSSGRDNTRGGFSRDRDTGY